MNNFELIAAVFRTHPGEAFWSILLIFLPISAWIYIFTRKERPPFSILALTFLAGIGSALIMFLYQYFWERHLNFGFFELTPVNFQRNISSWSQSNTLSLLLVALSIGLIEEYLKHWVVKTTKRDYFRSVSDIIQLSIVTALGFAFTENIIYLFREFTQDGFSGKFFTLFVLRSVFVVFVHVLCSGIYGYYFGIGYYATPILEKEERSGRRKWIPVFFHRLVHWKKEVVFQDEMVTFGLLVSMVVHGIFDFFMSVNWTLGSILGINVLKNVGIHVIILPLYLVGGFLCIWHLLEKKEHYEKYGRVIMKKVYVEHDLFKNLQSMNQLEQTLEKKFEHEQKEKVERNFSSNVELLEKFEQSVSEKYRQKLEKAQKKKASPEEVLKNLEAMEKIEEKVRAHYEKKGKTNSES